MGTTVKVIDNGTNGSGIVGDDGQVYLSGLSSTGSVMAKWGNEPDQQCQAHWTLKEGDDASLQTLSVQCE